MLILQKSKLNCKTRFRQIALIRRNPVWRDGKRCFTFVIISHAWKWLFFTKCSRTLREPSESLWNRRPCYFPFHGVATVTVQFAVCTRARRKIEDTKQDKRARGEAFWKVSAVSVRVHRSANIKWSPLYHSCLSVLCRGRFPGSILSPPLPSVLFM